MLLPMVGQTRLVILLGLAQMVTVVGTVIQPKMVMQAQAQTLAVGAPLIDCHLHHHPHLALGIDFRLENTTRSNPICAFLAGWAYGPALHVDFIMYSHYHY